MAQPSCPALPRFTFGGDTCGLQLWVPAVVLCYSHAGGQAALQTLFAWGPSAQLQLILYLTKKLDKLLTSSLHHYCKNIWRMSWCWRTGEKKFDLLLAVKRWGRNWKVPHFCYDQFCFDQFCFLFAPHFLPCPHIPPFLCQKQWQKYLYICFKYVVGKFSF